MTFAERARAHDGERADAAARVRSALAKDTVDTVRLSFADQHGILRGKTLVAGAAAAALDAGHGVPSSLLAKDTAHRTVFDVWNAPAALPFPELRGARDVVMLPDPSTYRELPWAPRTGWMLCDLYFRDGSPATLSTRTLYRTLLDALAREGYAFLVGLEVELHLFRLDDPMLALHDAGQPGTPPAVSLLTRGYQHLTELRYDALAPILDVLRENLIALGLPLRSMEVEYGPSQCELTFDARTGIEPADMMVLARSAVKQVARRNGYHATFMCRPRIPEVMSSGWHLHQSLVDASGANAFVAPAGGDALLSGAGRAWLGGLLANARASAALCTPTINGYRRYRPNSLAPDRAAWGIDNRGVMLRVVGAPGDPATHIENRLGEPAANPYLYLGAQIVSGLDGLRRGLDPGAPADAAYAADAARLPTTLEDALDALEHDATFRDALGGAFVDYFVAIKRAEVARFRLDVTEWEQREYFEIF